MRLSSFFCILYFSLFSVSLLAYDCDRPENDAGYYLFPIRPGQTNFLAGTMGELRSTHFHAGIDIKTGGVEGLNVYAAADGYVSRIKVSTSGYGNTLYVAHPNGTTTVYAHLSSFNDVIGKYVLNKQYENRSFAVELFPQPSDFPVKKGDVIALSGNSGSSSGPHLHFEIRDENQHVLNPLNYAFDEIRDNIPPLPRRLKLVTKSFSSRVEGRFGDRDYTFLRNGTTFTLKDTVKAFGNIGAELYVHDRLNGAPNNNGFPCISVTVNNHLIFDQQIEEFAFSEQKNLYVYSNYREMRTTGRKYHKLYVDDGNELNFYKTLKNNGFINVAEDSVYHVIINTGDSYGNQSTVQFYIKGSKQKRLEVQHLPYVERLPTWDILENTLFFTAAVSDKTAPITEVYVNRQKVELLPEYVEGNKAVYLWDLRLGLPDSIDNCEQILKPHLKSAVPAGARFKYFDKYMDFSFNTTTLFDTLYLQTDYHYDSISNLEYFEFGDTSVPLKRGFRLNLKPKRITENNTEYEVYAVWGRNYSYHGGTWKGNEISFYTTSFGTFTLLRDSIAPEIVPIKINQNQLRFVIRDRLSGIKDFNVYVDGKWVLMEYDYKKNLITSKKLDETIPFKGEFLLTVEDRTGNINSFKTKL